jgi:hypothetical protein
MIEYSFVVRYLKETLMGLFACVGDYVELLAPCWWLKFCVINEMCISGVGPYRSPSDDYGHGHLKFI